MITAEALTYVQNTEKLAQNYIRMDILGEQIRRAGVAVDRQAKKVSEQYRVILKEIEGRRGV